MTDSDSSFDDGNSSGNVIQPQLHTSTNGVTWSSLLIARVKPATAANVFQVKPGVHPVIWHRASISPYECWMLFIDNNMLRAIQTHTNREARKIDPNFSLMMEQLEAFIALQYTRDIYGKHHSVHLLWKKTYGPSIFRGTTARDCFLEIKKFIRFFKNLPYLSSIHKKANCIAVFWTVILHSLGSCHFRVICLPHKGGVSH